MSSDKDLLFSTERIAGADKTRRSVIVVGLPRSGSSFLSHALSQIPDWYVFDDLYTYRIARKIGALGPLNDKQLQGLLLFLGWQIRARLRFGLYAIPEMTEDEIEEMNDALFQCFSGQGATWLDLQKEWLIRLAERRGCTNWGYKMPGAFRHLDTLFETYPDMKAIFLMRAPHQVLSSYKHIPEDSQDGDPAQYHPVAYAWYWRAAARAWLRAKEQYPDRVTLIRFHELVRDPTAAGREMAEFLGADVPDVITAPEKPNSSFSAEPGKRPGLTYLETQITKQITDGVARELGFPPIAEPPGHSLSDYADFANSTWKFSKKRVGSTWQFSKRRVESLIFPNG